MLTPLNSNEKITFKDKNKTYQDDVYKNLSDTSSISVPKDYSTPFRFSEWIQTQPTLEPNTQYNYYLQYVFLWYSKKFTPEKAKVLIKSNYVKLLQQLNIIFKDEISEKWYNELDINSDLDLQDMIEFYSRKLKQISMILAEKREFLKQAKTKYNLVGSNYGVAKLFTDYILNAFTNKQYHDKILINAPVPFFPSLTSINNSFKIEVQELYDETNYFDKNPNIPVSTYFNLTSPTLTDFITGIGFEREDVNWLYALGQYNLQLTEAQLTSALPLSGYGNFQDQVTVQELLTQLAFEYTSVQQFSSVSEITTPGLSGIYNFSLGNNWFFWPSGEHFFDFNYVPVRDIPINQATILTGDIEEGQRGTAGDTYLTSDRIFVFDRGQVKGAWAHAELKPTEFITMSAYIPGRTNLLFKFPYPGYGLASPTLEWTGKTHENITDLYRFLDPSTQQIIESFYFSDTANEIVAVDPIPINNSSLVEFGARPGKTRSDADYIIFHRGTSLDKMKDDTPDNVFTGEKEVAWLFDVTKTNIPLAVGKTNVLWPLETFKDSATDLYVPPDNYCLPVELSGLNANHFIGCRPGYGLYDSDTIYIIDTITNLPSEAAYLQGKEIKQVLNQYLIPETTFTAEICGVHQPGIYLRCYPGQYTTFLWADFNKDINESTITYHKIPKDSPYNLIKHKSIYNSRYKDLPAIYEESEVVRTTVFDDFGAGPGIGDWKVDNSRSVLFSPIGHPGDKYDDYDRMCDIIFVDHTFPEPFSLTTWKDTAGRDYKTSPDFAWFKLDSSTKLQPDVGWGPGRWVNYNGTGTFVLSGGYQYKYLRTSLRRPLNELQIFAVPYLAMRQPFTIKSAEWKKAVLDGTKFIETSANTDIVLYPGDNFVYDHYNLVNYCLTSIDTRGLGITTNYPRVTSNDFTNWVNNNIVETGQTIAAAWPLNIFTPSFTTGPGIENGSRSYSYIEWNVTNTEGLTGREIMLPGYLFLLETFADISTVEYTISATGYFFVSSDQGGNSVYTVLEPTKVFKVSAIPVTTRFELTGVLLYDIIQNLTIPAEICVPLKGWDTILFNENSISEHARPIWVSTNVENTLDTKFKGMSIGERSYSFANEIILKTQPNISNAVFDTNTVIDYHRTGLRGLTWAQPLTYNDPRPVPKWKKLKVESDISPLTAFTCEPFSIPIIEGTNELSDIVLKTYDIDGRIRQQINYFALNDFTWIQPLTSTIINQQTDISSSIIDTSSSTIAINQQQSVTTTFDITSTPGIFPSSLNYPLFIRITPEKLSRDYLNRHFPTAAVFPYLPNIVTEDETGIYKPSNLGIPMYLGKNHITETLNGNVVRNANIFYESDFGLTKQLNPSLFTRKKYNAQWMKAPATFIAKSGVIYKSKPYEKFIPYQNRYEIFSENNTGITSTKDLTDPWIGPLDSTWSSNDPNLTDFRGSVDPILWSTLFIPPTSMKMYDWNVDIYNNNYALFKPIIVNQTPYEFKTTGGEIWIRDANDNVGKLTTRFKDLLTDLQGYTNVYNDVIHNEVKSIMIIKDQVILITKTGIGIFRVYFDYNLSTLKLQPNSTRQWTYKHNTLNITNIYNDVECECGSGLHITETNRILLPVIGNYNDHDREPEVNLVELNLSNYKFSNRLSTEIRAEIDYYLSTNMLTEAASPVVTYNPFTKKYNMSYLARKHENFDGDHLISITFSFIGDEYTEFNFKAISPTT